MLLQMNIIETTVELPLKFHRWISTLGKLIHDIMACCNGIEFRFPPESANSNKVIVSGSKEDVEEATKRLLEIASDKVKLNL